jgi:hypothetical protein
MTLKLIPSAGFQIQCLENCGPRSARQAIPCLEHAHLYTDDGYFHDARRPVVVFCDDMCPIAMDYFEKPMASKGCGMPLIPPPFSCQRHHFNHYRPFPFLDLTHIEAGQTDTGQPVIQFS